MLQVIMGQASLIEMQEDTKSGVSEAASLIKSASLKGASLVKQLLNYSASDVIRAEKLPIKEVFESSRDLYRAILGANASLKINYHAEDAKISFDRNQLQQIISNILVNAREAFTNGSGRVQIDVARTVLRSGEIDPEIAPGRYVRIDIRDDGVGMSEEVRNRCFEPFYTTKNTDPNTGIGVAGSGLGLSTVYSIIKKNRGTITVESSEFAGSIFSIYLPEVGFESDKLDGREADSVLELDSSNGDSSDGEDSSVVRYREELN
jgi:two-component system cell cycle sensor histidine kinase/response regulator CckA